MIVRADQRALYCQFERTDILKPERPGDPQFNLALVQNLLIHFKTDGFATEIAGPASADVSHAAEPVREAQF
jgi:hypothetical protein